MRRDAFSEDEKKSIKIENCFDVVGNDAVLNESKLVVLYTRRQNF